YRKAKPMLAIDAHLDLAMNAIQWNRDLEQPVAEIRRLEAGLPQKGRAAGTVAFPEMRRGEVAVSVATVIARVSRAGNPLAGYATPEIASAVAEGQRVYYELMEAKGQLRLLRARDAIDSHIAEWGGGVRCSAIAHFAGTRVRSENDRGPEPARTTKRAIPN